MRRPYLWFYNRTLQKIIYNQIIKTKNLNELNYNI